jgi:hypothetical protein
MHVLFSDQPGGAGPVCRTGAVSIPSTLPCQGCLHVHTPAVRRRRTISCQKSGRPPVVRVAAPGTPRAPGAHAAAPGGRARIARPGEVLPVEDLR